MSQRHFFSGVSRRAVGLDTGDAAGASRTGPYCCAGAIASGASTGGVPADPLASWNEGPTTQAILDSCALYR